MSEEEGRESDLRPRERIKVLRNHDTASPSKVMVISSHSFLESITIQASPVPHPLFTAAAAVNDGAWHVVGLGQ